jgi:hypothetical protein
MAEATAAGASSSADGLTAAEKLMQQHAANETHKVTVEDVPDDEAASSAPPPLNSSDSARAPAAAVEVPVKTAGKQPARDAPLTANRMALDTKSEELFPALGSSKAPAATPSMWSRKPAAVGKASNGLTNGAAASSGASTPQNSGNSTSGAASSQRGPAQMNLPGRYTESITLYPNMMTPKSQLKKPVVDILRDINKHSKANISIKAGPGGAAVLDGTGPVDAVRLALKEAATQLCSKVGELH